MLDPVLEYFRGKDCAFVANWLRGKGLNKLCAVFKGIQILILLILDSGSEYILRADVSKYRPEVCKSEKSKILKKINKVALGKLLT